MPQLTIPTIASLIKLLTEVDRRHNQNAFNNIIADHVGIYVTILFEALHFYKLNGYAIKPVKVDDDFAIITKGKEKIKLITGKKKEYTAYRILDSYLLNLIEETVEKELIRESGFSALEYIFTDRKDYKEIILTHETGDRVHLIWENTVHHRTSNRDPGDEGPDNIDPPSDDPDPVPLNPNPPVPVLEDAAKETD